MNWQREYRNNIRSLYVGFRNLGE